jgi:hypothetical protein
MLPRTTLLAGELFQGNGRTQREKIKGVETAQISASKSILRLLIATELAELGVTKMQSSRWQKRAARD